MNNSAGLPCRASTLAARPTAGLPICRAGAAGVGSGKAAGSARTARTGRTAKRATTFILTDRNGFLFLKDSNAI